MRRRTSNGPALLPAGALLAGALLAGIATPVAAGGLELEGQAPLTATPEGGEASGSFVVRTRTSRARERTKLRIDVGGLVVDDGQPAEYQAVLLAPGPGPRVELGSMRERVEGAFRLRLRRATGLLPDSHPTLRHFEGGTLAIERVKPDPATVLTATIPALHAPDAGDWVSSRRTWGRFEAIDIPRQSPGSFQLRTESYSDGEFRNRVAVVSSRLSPSSYSVYLVNRARTWTVNLGAMKLLERYGATFHLDSRTAPYPAGVTNLASFDGGRIEVRRGSTVVLRAGIPELRGVAEPGIRQRVARARGTEELLPPGGGVARGWLWAGLSVAERSRRQRMELWCAGLEPSASSLRLVAVPAEGPSMELGRFDARGELGVARFRLPNARSGAFPPGGVLDLSRVPIEVRDRFGNAVLSGVFPRVD